MSVKNGKNESTNTFLSSSLQKSPPTDSPLREEILSPPTENINETISTILPEQKLNDIERDGQSTPDLLEEQKEATPATPSSGLNPEATPFFVERVGNTERIQSISTGDESDDETDSNETPVTSGR